MNSTLRFQTGGLIDCLYTEAIPLHALGRLTVFRATDIRFNPSTQEWDVCHATNGEVLFSHPSRGECLRWETLNLQPQPASTEPNTNPIPNLQHQPQS
jgi:hypothetical protein